MARTRDKKQTKTFISIPWLWLLFGITLGVLVYSMLFDDSAPTVTKGKQNLSQAPQQANTEPASKNYDFYKLLAKDNQDNSNNTDTINDKIKELKKSNALALKTDKLPTANYIIQAGSFRKLTDAEKLKAKLAFIGIVAKILPITLKDETWYRIHLGPFATKDLAKKEQSKLQDNQISGSLLVRTNNETNGSNDS